MSYLTPAASTTQYGVVEIGSNINVTSGIISLAQDVSPTGNPVFASATITGVLIANGNQVVQTVTPTAGPGVSLTSVISAGPTPSFTVNNTGVLSAIAGTGISVSAGTGNVTIANTGVTSIIAGTGVTISGPTGAVTISASGASVINTHLVTTGTYTPTASDEYIGVNSTLPVTITLPTGINGTLYIIKEEHGLGFGVITIQGTGGQLIDGIPTALVGISHASITLVFRGTEWHIV